MLRDLIIVLPGIMGSVLRRGEDEVWNPGPGLAGKLLRHRSWVESLVLDGTDDPADVGPIDGIVPTRLVQSATIVPYLLGIEGYSELHSSIVDAFGADVVEGDPMEPSRRLDGKSSAQEGVPNYFRFAYDWRRDIRVSALRLHLLIEEALGRLRDEQDPDAKVVLIAHSMGGLVARSFMYGLDPRSGDPFDGWRNVRELLSLGTPYRGSPDALDNLANGLGKLFIDLSEALRSYTGVYHLLPRYPMIRDLRSSTVASQNRGPASDRTGWLYPHELEGVPGFSAARAGAAYRDLHLAIDQGIERTSEERHALAMAGVGRTVPHLGFGHRTANSAVIDDDGLRLDDEVPGYLHGVLTGGDGTVPTVSAIPLELDGDRQALRATNQKHGSLQVDRRILAQEISTRLQQSQASTAAAHNPPGTFDPTERPAIGLDVPLLGIVGERAAASATVANGDDGSPIEISLTDLATMAPVGPTVTVAAGEPIPLPEVEGDYRLTATTTAASADLSSTALFAVVDP